MTVEVPVDTVGAFVGPPRMLARGVPGGPLDGMRVGAKGVFDLAGEVTRAGNPSFARGRAPAAAHAVSVQRLVDAGASIVGVTITDELAYSLAGDNVHDGAPLNVAAPGCLAGGSSSGSASAVAAGLVELGLGTDTGGSIRVPASYCGLYGWRPTHGAVDTTGVVPLAPSFDTVGLLGVDIDVVRRGVDALLGLGPSPCAIGQVSLLADTLRVVAPSVALAVTRTTAALLGRAVSPVVDLGLDLAEAAEAFRVLQAREAWLAHGAWFRRARPEMAPEIAARFASAAKVTDADVAAALQVRAAVSERLRATTDAGAVLAMPAAAHAAPPITTHSTSAADLRGRTMQLTAPIGLAGLPVVVVPGARVDDRPIGVAFVGAAGSDRALLDLVASFRRP